MAIHTNGREKRATLMEAMRAAISTREGPFTASELREEIAREHPHLVGKLTSICVGLIDMTRRGEVFRKGAGHSATYTKGKLKEATTDREKAYREFRATVPMPATNEA